MSNTTNLGLVLTPEEDSSTTFKAWRLAMNGESNSNMIKIDNAYGELKQAVCDYYAGVDLTVKFADEVANYSSAWAWIQDRISNGLFDGIHVADYIPFSVTVSNTQYTYHAQIAGINTYKGYGDAGYIVGNHIDFVCDKLWVVKHAYNKVNYNNGVSYTNQSPWTSSDLYYWLNGRSGQTVGFDPDTGNPVAVDVTYSTDSGAASDVRGLISYLPATLIDVIVEKRLYVPFRFDRNNLYGGTNLKDNTGAGWIDIGKLWCPAEVEVFGYPSWAIGAYGGGAGYVHYPLFHNTNARIKGLNGAADTVQWWLIDPINGLPSLLENNSSLANYNYTRVSVVMNDGRVAPYNTANVGPGVPVCFRIA